jgi:mono/diheme cytochrome c family protein
MRLALTISVLAVALGACRGGESKDPPVHLIPNMDTQEKGRAYRVDTTGLFMDGRMMRMPVEGTVPVGALDDDDLLNHGMDDKGQPSLTFPDSVKQDGKVSDAARARGKGRYGIYCAPCHGVAGDGQGTVAQKALDGGPRLTVPPPSFHDARLKGMPVGKIYAAIELGVNNGNMPSYAMQIPTDDRWAIIAYIRELQRSRDASVADEGGEVVVVANATTSSKEHGEQLYKAKGCNACHSVDGSKLVGPSFKGLWGKTEGTSAGDVVVDDAYLKESLLNPNAKIVNGFPPAMPPQQLTDVEIGSISLFIQAQK